MLGKIISSFFDIKKDTGRGIGYHYLCTPQNFHTSLTAKMRHLTSPILAQDLRENVVPEFMRKAKVKDFREGGFWMAVDVSEGDAAPIVHLVSGIRTANPNPQDWRIPRQRTIWDPTAPVPYFDHSAEDAQQGLANTRYGSKLYYAGEEREVFGVEDGDPKAETHILMLFNRPFGTLMDSEVTTDHWQKLFRSAYQILESLGIAHWPTRYLANFGSGYQFISRLHIHVLNSPYPLPSMFPQDYGFKVLENGKIEEPEGGSGAHQEVIKLIDKRREIQGFGLEQKAQRKIIDGQIMEKLGKIRIF